MKRRGTNRYVKGAAKWFGAGLVLLLAAALIAPLVNASRFGGQIREALERAVDGQVGDREGGARTEEDRREHGVPLIGIVLVPRLGERTLERRCAIDTVAIA